MQEVMKTAWEIARQGAAKFGGKPSEYIGMSIAIAHVELRKEKEACMEKKVYMEAVTPEETGDEVERPLFKKNINKFKKIVPNFEPGVYRIDNDVISPAFDRKYPEAYDLDFVEIKCSTITELYLSTHFATAQDIQKVG